MSLPIVTVIGTVTAQPELKFIPSGKAVANFSIAANSRRKNKDTGEWEDGDTTFLRANVWGEYAENIAETLEKGSRVIATGQLKQRSWEKEGNKQTSFELEVEEIGPSLRYATAKVTKVSKTSGGGGGNYQPNSFSGTSDEPPF